MEYKVILRRPEKGTELENKTSQPGSRRIGEGRRKRDSGKLYAFPLEIRTKGIAGGGGGSFMKSPRDRYLRRCGTNA